MMMITATIFATGPSTDSRMDCSGASQDMDEPEAQAGDVIRLTQAKAPAVAI
ncbi:hypothetical protein SAMN05519105_4015 [Rhodobacter sp. 24-YEA-8]|nr:hypothetical protein SAMN05519105_4015 [Rhodobacter sp. 24-YEA-8]